MTVLGCGSDEVSIMSIFYPCVSVNVSSLGYYLSVGSYSKTFHYYFPPPIWAWNIQDYFKKKIWRKQKFIYPNKDKGRREERRKKTRLTEQNKLIFGFWESIYLDSRADNSSDNGKVTVTKGNEDQYKE